MHQPTSNLVISAAVFVFSFFVMAVGIIFPKYLETYTITAIGMLLFWAGFLGILWSLITGVRK